jgi:hypothetical protein
MQAIIAKIQLTDEFAMWLKTEAQTAPAELHFLRPNV